MISSLLATALPLRLTIPLELYIEVSISDQTVNHSPTSYLTAGYPTVTSHTLGTDTPVERLEKLENMKHLLSNHEYEAKRSDILAAV